MHVIMQLIQKQIFVSTNNSLNTSISLIFHENKKIDSVKSANYAHSSGKAARNVNMTTWWQTF